MSDSREWNSAERQQAEPASVGQACSDKRSTLLSVATIKHPDREQLRGERVYLGSVPC